MLRNLALWTSLLVLIQVAPRPAAAPPIEVSRAQFAQYIEELSEPEGSFDTDNFISNETSYLHVIPELRRQVKPGNVYLGVGPDQNFPYIAHTRPALAIISDIRRQNMLQHLLYKALFDMSASRAEFAALLFSRETPKVDKAASLPELLNAVRRAPSSEARYRTNIAAIRQRLLTTYGLKLSARDLGQIAYVYQTFFEEGLDLRFSSIGRNNASNYPTFQSLLLQTDRTGKLQGYLMTEDMFLWMKKFEAENRLIPIVGDFAGPKAFKAMGAFLKKNGLQVSTFYTSNVEYYLFQDGKWGRYVENVRALPVTADAVFIRSYFGNGAIHPQNVPGHRATSLVHNLPEMLRDQAAGRIRSYWDVVGR
jgi:uncharacterized protein (DUF2461 family)